MRSGGRRLAVHPVADFPGHLVKDLRLNLPGCERRNDSDKTAVPGDKGGASGRFDLTHDVGQALVEVAHGVNEGLAAASEDGTEVRYYI